ncbi:hypothetical protein FQN50_001941 [Emmonsiellopsis sp. PD_5]|nr:hypothetical protein FQN50_001941 [Emmonsiellopsis sp. PD_5]
MTGDTLDTSGLAALRSSESQTLLDEIDSLRRRGISEFVFLPQIVVCGDQSSGKSSVLEAISGVPFPRNDTLCTRFATEVILREAAVSGASVSIVPCKDATSDEQQKLSEFKETLQGLQDLPGVIDRAKVLMGITMFGSAFSKHVLRIEISGPQKPKLTLVDLPGLIHSENKQQSEADVKLISNLVESYITNPRSIIISVVSAKNDIANQIILKRARKVDPKGLRTLGLITKPDTLPAGSDSEAEFIDLASNNNIEFRLGWHVLRNRDFDSRDASTEERDLVEQEFFSIGAWKDLPRNTVGICSLRQRLSKILLNQIKVYLPNLINDIQTNIDDAEKKLQKLGVCRATVDEQRLFLLKISQSFERLCKAAADGSYGDPFFGNKEYDKRLRALIQNHNIEFAENMRTQGHHRIIDNSKMKGSNSFGQIHMSRSGAIRWVRGILTKSRGRELPGSFNPILVGELFQDQSSPWEGIARRHVESSWKLVTRFLEELLETVTDSHTFHSLLNCWISRKTNDRMIRANQSLNQLLVDRVRHPITYNHYYTENLQKMRQANLQDKIAGRIQNFITSKCKNNIDLSDVTALAASLSTQSESDMDDFACAELLDCMQAFYKVAMKTFVDNVAIQVIERELICEIWTIFTPSDVATMPPDLISRIAGETEESQVQRQQLERKLKTLQEGLEICRRHAIHPRDTEQPDDVESVSGEPDDTPNPEDSDTELPVPPEMPKPSVDEFTFGSGTSIHHWQPSLLPNEADGSGSISTPSRKILAPKKKKGKKSEYTTE